MEPSKIFGGTEDSYSSESGWTMYIGSPIDGSDDDDDGGDGGGGCSEADDDDYGADNGRSGHADDETDDANHEADTDDSMASDASSGPSHQGQFYGNMGGHHGRTSDFKQDEDDKEERHTYLDKKAQKSMEKQKLEMKKKEEDKEEKQAASTQSRNGSEVKKSI